MGHKAELSDEAATKRKTLPPNIKDDVDQLIARLAASPPSLGGAA